MTKLIPSDQVALPSDLKRANRQNIMKVLRTGRTMTAADIHQETGISRPTVMRALQHYCDLGVVKSLGLGSTTSMGGKKPELFTFDNRRRLLLINLWPEEITLGLSGLIGDVFAVEHFPGRMTGDLDEAFEPLKNRADEYLTRHGVTPELLYAVVMTVPGTVDYETRLLRYNVKAPGWGTDVPVAQKLQGLFGGAPICLIDNAGKAAGRAVLLDSADYAQKRLITFFTTWGVSACMMEKGHVLNGRDSLIGEIGHMVLSDTGPVVCGCGKRGCLESLVSPENVNRMLNRPEKVSIPQLFRLSEAGDEEAQRVARYLAHCFAVALHNLSLCYNQELVVFQGDFAWADKIFDVTLKRELSEFRYYPELFQIAYDRRELPLLAARGGAELIKRRFFSALD